MMLRGCLLFLLSVASVQGASITVTNNIGPINTNSVVDYRGVPVDGGWAALGTISDPTTLVTVTGGVDLLQVFTVFDGTEGPVNSSPFAGTFTIQSLGEVAINTTDFAGAPMYLVLTDSPSLESSGLGFAILEIGTFPAFEPAVDTVFVDATSNIVARPWVSGTPHTLAPSPIGGQNPAITLGAPEPSSSLLMCLAGLLLAARRRR
ncbi:MAG: PEP-CTERM sorting domain-containing protein [Roseibacillus sp.]|nr:PEP-CTERM sorting domain-containing protein [Roseibacillus sp.]